MMPLTPAPLPQRGEGIRERVLYNREALLIFSPFKGEIERGMGHKALANLRADMSIFGEK
jgi:hypothetical protein